VGKYVRSILVEDASGAQFNLYEFLDRRPVLGLARKARRYELETGEAAEPVDDDMFAIVATGERLVRVQ
jgi:hypothetical protein